MSLYQIPLDDIRVASPCSADWNKMYGNERMRFCGACNLNVYNLSGMTREEAERLVIGAEGRLCVRFYRRSDGTIITKDCPVGLARVKQKTRMIVTAAFSMIATFFTGLFFMAAFEKKNEKARTASLIGEIEQIVFDRPLPVMGNITIPADRLDERPGSQRGR